MIVYEVKEFEYYDETPHVVGFYASRELAENAIQKRRKDASESFDTSSGNKLDDWYTWRITEHVLQGDATHDKLKAEVGKLRALLLGVLENDEVAEGENNSNLNADFKQNIRDAIAWKV